MSLTVAPPGYWDKAAQRIAQAYQAGELLYPWPLEDLWQPRRMRCFAVEVPTKPRLAAQVYFLEGQWLASETKRNRQDWLWQPRAHSELGYRDYLKALRLAEPQLQQVLAGPA